jgi:integrase
MSSVHRNPRSPKGVYYAALRLADGRRAWRSTKTRDKTKARIIADAWQAAEAAAANAELSHDRVLEILNETLKRIGASSIEYVNVKDWLREWLESKQGQIAESSLTAYTQVVDEFIAYLGERGSNRRLDAITTADIEGFIRLLRKEGRCAATINKLVRKYLSAPFEKARKIGKLRFNPVMATSPEKSESLVKETFTGDQVVALLSVADPDWQGMILFAYGSGARLSDCRSLKWSNLDVANRIVTFREKQTQAQAVLGLHADFLDWLSTRPAPDDDDDAPVFPTLADKDIKGRDGLSNTFVELLDKAGIEKRFLRQGNSGKGRPVRALSFHSFRHTAASNVFNQAAIREITRRVTNHAAGGVVDRYIHEDLESIRAATQLIPRLPKLEGEQK